MPSFFPGVTLWTTRECSRHRSFHGADWPLPRLLVGVDEERKEIACGLVDTIGTVFPFPRSWVIAYSSSGSYTFAKTLEYKAKHGLNSGKEVTVMPPAEYQDRFVSALEGYFLACPGLFPDPLPLQGKSSAFVCRQVVQTAGRITDPQRP
jgi:hypothetical protein